MDDFYRTRMGVRFFGTTLPKIADELEQLNRNIEALVAAMKSGQTDPLQGDPTKVLDDPDSDPE